MRFRLALKARWLVLPFRRMVGYAVSCISASTCVTNLTLRATFLGNVVAYQCALTSPPCFNFLFSRSILPSLTTGYNSHGQLGVAHKRTVEAPHPLASHRWKALSLGDGHAAGVGDGGEVYTWGCNDKGQLGAQGGPRAGTWDVPRRMELLYGWDVRGIACGADHTVAVTPQDVITWGSNEHGQCGHGERAEREWVKPRSLKLLNNQMVAQVVCGRNHTLCVTATSVVYAWGQNQRGQLGLGDFKERRSPTVVHELWALPVLQLATGDNHSAALTSNGFLFTWGGNDRGQLGLPVDAERAQIEAMQRTASERRKVVRRVNQRFLQAMGEMGIPQDQAELALAETGNVGVEVAAEWLFSMPPDLLETHLSGDPDTPTTSFDVIATFAHTEEGAAVLHPRRVPLQGVRAMAAGGTHTVAITDEEVYSWGDNSYGQLGIRTFKDVHHPVEIEDLAGAGVISVACGMRHSIFICRDGRVFGCGDSSFGAMPLEEPDPAVCFGAINLSQDDFPALGPALGGAGEETEIESPFESDIASTSTGKVLLPTSSTSSLMISTLACNVAAPTLMNLDFLAPKKGAKAQVVTHAVAGRGSSAFLTRAADELPDTPAARLWERLQVAVASAKVAPQIDLDGHIKPIASAVERVFGSAAAISAAFGLSDQVGLDVALLDSLQSGIMGLEPPPAAKLGEPQPEQDDLHRALRKAADALILELEQNMKLLGTPERAQVVLAALQSPLLGDTRCSNSLIPRICNILLAAPTSCRHLLVRWWSEYPEELLERRVVCPLQRYLTDELYATKKLTVAVMNAIKVLALVEEANQTGRKLPPEAFYNELISEKLDVLDHYVAWRQTHDMPQHSSSADGPFSFCSYPFLLNPRAKSKLLHTEARIQMDQTVADARAAHQAGRPDEEERVVPNIKQSRLGSSGLGSKIGSSQQPSTSTGSGNSGGILGGNRRRRDRGAGGDVFSSGGGLRWLLGRHGAASPAASPGAAQEGEVSSTASDIMLDDRYPSSASSIANVSSMMIGASVGGAAAAAATATPGGNAQQQGHQLWKQGSLGLPTPDDSGFPATHPDMCILRVRRGHLLEDALNEVARQRPRDLFKPLRVHFIGEDGVDAGGVKKEFFQLLLERLLCPDYGMLVHQDESNTYWFSPSTMEADDEFLLLGLVVGLSVYNGVLLDLPLPLALYRKVLGQEVRLRDLEDMQPTLGRSLRSLLQYEGPEPMAEVFCQNFTVEMQVCGETQSVELTPGGEDVLVTEDNRREFVDSYVNWWLNASIHRQFEAFAKGILMLCGGPALQLFSATELERLVCGSPCLDFDALVRSARYEGGYHPEHRVVQWLWQVVSDLTAEEKKLFLKFFTGSDRAPIGGLANLRVIIQRDGADSTKLPTSHTCFNTLLLPSYRSKNKLEDRLKLAILNAEGFGLE